MVSVGVPVTYRDTVERMKGFYSLVVWENKATPCFPGREVTGIPKVFADIEDFHQLEDNVFSHASYEGTSFLEIGIRKKRRLSPEEVAAANLGMKPGEFNWFGWRYIPNIGKPGAALSSATVYPQDIVFRELYEGRGIVKWQSVTWEKNPTQAHIIAALSMLPIKQYRGCAVSIGGMTVLRDDLARQLP